MGHSTKSGLLTKPDLVWVLQLFQGGLIILRCGMRGTLNFVHWWGERRLLVAHDRHPFSSTLLPNGPKDWSVRQCWMAMCVVSSWQKAWCLSGEDAIRST